jgi:hypothetical protein
MNKGGKIFVICLALALLASFLFAFNRAKAATMTGQTVTDAKIDYQIKSNGRASARIDINTEANSNYLYWIIPYEEVNNLTIRQNDRIVLPNQVKKESGRSIVIWSAGGNYDSYQKSAQISYNFEPDLKFRSDNEFIQIIAINEPGLNINRAQISISYPDNLSSQVIDRYYAIHGVGDVQVGSRNKGKIDYSITNLTNYGIFSFEVGFTRGSLDSPYYLRLKNSISSFSIEWVILISILIPLLVYLYLFSLYRNHIYTKDIASVKGQLPKPPSQLSPAEVDILKNGKLTYRGIGALIIQLLNKEYLNIIEKKEGAVLGKIKEPSEELSESERILINILFKQKEFRGGMSQLKEKKKKEIFDHLTSKLYRQINKGLGGYKYFVGDNAKVRNNILRQGIIIFFISVLMSLFFLLFFPSSPWLAFAPASLIIGSLIVIRLRNYFTLRTSVGQEELVRWLKFKNYLKEDHPIESADRRKFRDYLPWTFLFSVSKNWLEKFIRYPMACPEWYSTCDSGQTIEEQIGKAFDLIDELSKEIAGLKSPLD